ncbi:MAG TPA: hypothetical protein VI670_11020 [Thermoanaerobaculia bacterium]|jgi:hypothetical protein
MSLYEIRLAGWRALTERLGPAGAMRFMMQYDPGDGDYTRERHQILENLTFDEIRNALNSPGPSNTRKD